MMMTAMTKNKKSKTILALRTERENVHLRIRIYVDDVMWRAKKHTLTIKKHFVRFNLQLKRKMCFKTLKHHHHRHQHVARSFEMFSPRSFLCCWSWLARLWKLFSSILHIAAKHVHKFFTKSHTVECVWRCCLKQQTQSFNVISAISIFFFSSDEAHSNILDLSCRVGWNDVRFHTNNNKKEFSLSLSCRVALCLKYSWCVLCCVYRNPPAKRSNMRETKKWSIKQERHKLT